MTQTIESVAERVIREHSEAVRMNKADNSYFVLCASSAPALAREVIELRKLCGVMREAVRLAVIELPLCLHAPIFDAECSRCQAHAALASYRAHFPSPDVNPAEPKEK